MKKPKQCVMYKFCGKEIPKHRHNFCSDKCRDLCNHTYYEKGELVIDEKYIKKTNFKLSELSTDYL